MIAKTKVKKTWNLLIKLAIVAMAYGFLYYQLFYQKKMDDAWDAFLSSVNQPGFYTNLLIVVAMMLINWSIESLKWQYLIKREESVSFLKAFKAVFAGLTVSIFTPNRTGEFLGRVFILEKAKTLKAIFITIIGSFSQFMVTLMVGWFAFVFIGPVYFLEPSGLDPRLFYGLTIAMGLLIFLLMLFYLNFRIIDPIISKLIKTRWKKISEYFHVFSLFKTRHLFKVFLFSLSRYLVFSLQFVILVRAFGVAIPYPEGLMLVALMFFVMTAIPTITLAELGIRGSVTIFLFGLYYQEAFSASRELAVFAASSLLWFINLAIPALIGSVFVFQLKFFPKNNVS